MKKRKPTRKRLTMLVTVSVPFAMTAAQARKEVKTLVTHQANWSADHDDVKALAVKPARPQPHAGRRVGRRAGAAVQLPLFGAQP